LSALIEDNTHIIERLIALRITEEPDLATLIRSILHLEYLFTVYPGADIVADQISVESSPSRLSNLVRGPPLKPSF
jgi:hypothetical protein